MWNDNYTVKASTIVTNKEIPPTVENTPLSLPLNDVQKMNKKLFIEFKVKVQVPVRNSYFLFNKPLSRASIMETLMTQ